MPNLPIPTQTDAVAQSQATGAVDFLKFTGSTLTGSNLIDYGVGPAWKVVGEGDFNFDGHPDLVVQNQATGFGVGSSAWPHGRLRRSVAAWSIRCHSSFSRLLKKSVALAAEA